MMKDIKMILCDLDGTLLNDQKKISQYSKDIIQKARNKGFLFGIATGRSLYAVNRLMDDWGIKEQCDILLGFNGGQIIDESLGIHQINHPLKGTYFIDIIHHFEDLPCSFCIYDKNVLYSYKEDDASKNLAKSNKFEYRVIEDINQFFQKDYPKLVIVCKKEDMPIIIERSKSLINKDYYCMQTGHILFEYMNSKVSKSNGIKTVCDLHGLSLENVCVFGDAQNDRDMLKSVGLGVCMINGDEKTKEISHMITDEDNNHDGVAKFIAKYLI